MHCKLKREAIEYSLRSGAVVWWVHNSTEPRAICGKWRSSLVTFPSIQGQQINLWTQQAHRITFLKLFKNRQLAARPDGAN